MEFFDIVDEKGIPTGESIERTQAHKKGIRHRTAHIWIIREQDGKAQLLLQKRSAEKDSFPGRFDTSSAGHIQAGDEPEESAIRELYEELGIQASKEELQFAGCFDIQYEKEFHGSKDRVTFIVGSLLNGFEFPQSRLVVMRFKEYFFICFINA